MFRMLQFIHCRSPCRIVGLSTESDLEKEGECLSLLFENGTPQTTTLDALPAPVPLYKPSRKVVYWNRRAQGVVNLLGNGRLEMSFTKVVPKSLRTAVQEKLDEVVERGAARIEVPVFAPKGHTIPFEVRGALVSQKGNDFICRVARGVSQRKARPEELRRQKETRRLLVNQVEEHALFMLDRDGQWVEEGVCAKRRKPLSGIGDD